jgi:peptidoglycan/xylan/chitin deacetylase (PgdA/CDA1 family)
MILRNFVFVTAALIYCLGLSCCQTINRDRIKTNVPEKAVIFTFDDGPNAHLDTTARLLDVLAKYHIHAMFALLGENAGHNPELVRRIHDEGHTIINHGFNNKFVVYMKQDEFENNLILGENAIVSALGEKLAPLLYRPQGGFYTRTQQEIWESRGYTLVYSNARSYDAIKSGSLRDMAIRVILEKLDAQKGGIILLHDARDSWHLMEKRLAKDPDGSFNRSWVPDAVEELIITLLKKGYQICDPLMDLFTGG